MSSQTKMQRPLRLVIPMTAYTTKAKPLGQHTQLSTDSTGGDVTVTASKGWYCNSLMADFLSQIFPDQTRPYLGITDFRSCWHLQHVGQLTMEVALQLPKKHFRSFSLFWFEAHVISNRLEQHYNDQPAGIQVFFWEFFTTSRWQNLQQQNTKPSPTGPCSCNTIHSEQSMVKWELRSFRIFRIARWDQRCP